MNVKDVRPGNRDSDVEEAAIERYKRELTLFRRGYQSARTAGERPDTSGVDRRYADLLDMGISEGLIRLITDKVRIAVERERE